MDVHFGCIIVHLDGLKKIIKGAPFDVPLLRSRLFSEVQIPDPTLFVPLSPTRDVVLTDLQSSI